MNRVQLPDNAWADLRDNIDAAPRRLVRAVEAAERALTMVDGFQEIVDAEDKKTVLPQIVASLPLVEDVQSAQVLAFVTAWSYALPVTADGLGEIPSGAYEALVEEVEKLIKPVAAVTLADMADPTQALADSSA